MKKRIIALALALCCALGGVAMASGGTQADPLISKSYLEGTVFEQLRTSVTEWTADAIRPVYEAAIRQLDQLASAHLASLGVNTGESALPEGWKSSAQFTPLSGEKDDVVVLSPGSGLLLSSGSAVTGGVLVDATAGTEVQRGGTLTAGHRYIAAEQSEIVISSRTAQWLVEGSWKTDADGISVQDLPFTDVPEDSWYYDAVAYVVKENLFNGTGDGTTFSPMMQMQRGMLTTVLYRMAGSPAVEYSPLFSDVPNGVWYTAGVIWAGQNRVVSGNGNDKFLPGTNLTREQIAVILYNYANYLGKDVSARKALTAFSDGGSVSSWAGDAMSWAVAVGILQGSGGKVTPGNYATRAEVAIMLQRFQQWTAPAGE